MGPVQVLVVGFEHPDFSGEVLAEFDRLRDAGVVRLVDLLVVSRGQDGSLESVPLPEGSPADLGLVAAALLGQDQGQDMDAAQPAEPGENGGWSLEAVPPGSTAAVALIEHVWAGPVTQALERAGGRPLEETWLGPDDRAALEALLASSRSR
jgi:uncharacterized membrane protein